MEVAKWLADAQQVLLSIFGEKNLMLIYMIVHKYIHAKCYACVHFLPSDVLLGLYCNHL